MKKKQKKLWMCITGVYSNQVVEVGTILATNKPTPLQAQDALGFSGGDWWIFEITPKSAVELD